MLMPRWTEQSRELQRERCQKQRPWTRARGPSSPYGRAVSSQNARRKRPQFVSFVAPAVHDSDTCKPIQIGDCVSYIGDFQPTFDVCGGQPLKVVGFDEPAGAIACRTAGGKLVWMYAKDLQRCPDGQMKHESGNQS